MIALRRLFPFAASLLLTSASAPGGEPGDFRPSLRAFSLEMQQLHNFSPAELEYALGEASYRQDVIDAISRPAEAKPWYQYRRIFVTPSRAQAGAAYWQANKESLSRAADQYGVPPEIIVSIIGVETSYGRNTGKHHVVDALSTLAFSYPKRADFFRRELEQFLLLSREEGIDSAQARGSYAGALGRPQFIPSSYRTYAVDFDGDGRRDLWASDSDAIGSVASYLSRHGWQRGGLIAVPAQVEAPPPTHFKTAGMKPVFAVKELEAHGMRPGGTLNADTLVSIISLEKEDDEEYWLGLDNFYAITRYNQSSLYAMAVYQLSLEILALRQEPTGGRR